MKRTPAIVFKKRLSPSEVREHWIYIPKRYWSWLKPNSIVKAAVGDSVVEMRIDGWGRMTLLHLLWSDFLEALGCDPESDSLTFRMREDGLLEISAERPRKPDST